MRVFLKDRQPAHGPGFGKGIAAQVLVEITYYHFIHETFADHDIGGGYQGADQGEVVDFLADNFMNRRGRLAVLHAGEKKNVTGLHKSGYRLFHRHYFVHNCRHLSRYFYIALARCGYFTTSRGGGNKGRENRFDIAVRDG